jgi:hypothetical protein
MRIRECPFCGKKISTTGRDCPLCHETLPERRIAAGSTITPGRDMLRRGLFYMMCVAAIYYFLSPASPYKLKVPFDLLPLLTTYFLPLFFLLGLGIALYGLFQHVRARA